MVSSITTLARTGPSANRVDMVFLGDGYTAGELGTTYLDHVRGMVDYLFGGTALTEPFGRYHNFFNIECVNLASAESGADDPVQGIYRDTALNASYDFDGATDRLLYVDETAARAALSQALAGTGIDPELRFVTVNDDKYGGGGAALGFAAYAGGNPQAHEIALHESGHAFAGLADEYGGGGRYAGAEPPAANATMDPAGAKWADWMGYDQPGLGVIGAYEGAGLYDQGLYRPSADSKMRTLGEPFDAVARQQFVLDFYKLVDPLDGHSDNSGRLVNADRLHVDVIDPAIIKVDWTVNGERFVDAGEDFQLSAHGFTGGECRVEALAYDPTDWVRGDRSSLQESVSWTVELPKDHSYVAGLGDDVLLGSDGYDGLFGSAGNDRLLGNGGGDRLDGGAGWDSLFGGAGADLISGGRDGDRLDGEAGADSLHGGAGGDYLYGGAGLDALFGEGGLDHLFGGIGDDRLYGDAGRDVLEGGPGADRLSGGAGADTFVLRPGDGLESILDFRPGQDRIDVHATGVADYQALQPLLANAHGDTLGDFGNVQLQVAGVAPEALTANCWSF